MKFIQKNTPPQEFVLYSQKPTASYEDLGKKRKNRRIKALTKLSLAKEQGFICCYCGRRITGKGEETQIEHIWPKGSPYYESMQLDYTNNLIACCDGGKGDRKSDKTLPSSVLHCDTPKHDIPIPVNPLMSNCEKKFVYDKNGDVLGIGSDAEVTIKILNLTSPLLKNKRKAAIKAYSYLPSIDWKDEYKRLNQKDSSGHYAEFCFVRRIYIYFYHI